MGPSNWEIEHSTGLLVGATQVFSPHFDARPPEIEADLVLVHGIGLPPGEFGGPWIDRLFTGSLPPDAHPYFRTVNGRVSAHVLIRRDGSCVQYVPFHARAWHAGESSYEGRRACNDFSIGIELEGEDSMPYDDRQYAALNALLDALGRAYSCLSGRRIVGHSEVAPGRKTDPGAAFDWTRVGWSRISGVGARAATEPPGRSPDVPEHAP